MERLMQYIWQHRLWIQAHMRTVDDRPVQVIDPGMLNTDAGPDFFNAKVIIDGRLWAGNIEIHVKASDWHRHRHDTDPAYDSVILHVVERDDAVVRRSNGEVIPQLLMPCAPDFPAQYQNLVDRSVVELPCAESIGGLPRIYVTDWISTLAYERLYEKTDRIEGLCRRFAGDWEQVCYVTVARGLGFGLNGEPFERLALSLPLRFLAKHSDSPTSIEALLFGQSGLLTEVDEYSVRLKKEYDFLAHKFGLRPPDNLGWKLARMRPPNFPHRRIAVLAAMIHGGFRWLSRIVGVSSVEDAVALFDPELSGYWKRRYTFGHEMPCYTQGLSRSSASVMTINVVVPLMYAYGLTHGDTAMTDRAVSLLQSIKGETNSVTRLFAGAGIAMTDAFQTQGVIQLRRNYCEKRKCMFCRFGHRLLATKARRKS